MTGRVAVRRPACEGCEGPRDEPPDLGLYLVRFRDGHSARVWYCDECADLARIDWNGETAGITPALAEGRAL